MSVLDIKGVRIGEGVPKTIVSLMTDKDAPGFASDLDRLTTTGTLGRPDCIEWRADGSADLAPEALAGTCLALSEQLDDQPLIFTCRTKGQGGKACLDRSQYVAVLTAAIMQGEPDVVDIELGFGDDVVRTMVDMAHQQGIRALVSHHDFAGTPSEEDMEALLWRMIGLGADIPKLAVMAQTTHDAHDLMRATSHVHDQTDVPLLTLAMGTAGQNTRLTGEVFGSALTFCSLGMPSGPGQVALADAVRTMEGVHRAITGEQ